MIAVEELLLLFERMLREKWEYAWGAAREGCVDCSGAFVYAYNELNGPYIAHGSNSILRQSVGEILPMSSAKPGYAAFKIRPWDGEDDGNRWYGSDPGDAYHIGLVGRDGKILNAKGTTDGFVSSASTGWTGCAQLLDVSYTDETQGDVMYRAQVTTEKDPLRVRSWPENGEVIGSIPKGEIIDVLSDVGDGWPRVNYNGLIGYASDDFLTEISDDPVSPNTTIEDSNGQRITLQGTWRVVG